MEQATTLSYETPPPPVPPPVTQEASWYGRIPLYIKIAVALVLGVIAGVLVPQSIAKSLNYPGLLILRLLGAIAPPLILVAVVRALLGANVKGRTAGRMFGLLAMNTMVAILIGIAVANVIRPGRHASLPPGEVPQLKGNPIEQLLENVPRSVLAPLVENQVIGVIFIAVAFALAARRLDERRRDQVMSATVLVFDLILIV